MKSDTLLDYAEFLLSPNHSRCQLFVSSRGTTEQLASGLLTPFLAHLKLAQDQLAFSLGSIKLQLQANGYAQTWFTKGTIERFVRFVSTPEVLELVNTLHSEMSQLEAAQKLYSQGVSSQLFGAGGNGSGVAGGSDATKKELLRAIDVRLSAVKQDLTTALYCAVSAGFNERTVSELQMFSDQFNAHRLNEACTKFLTLCEKRPQLISSWKVGLDDKAIRCSYGSDMSIDEDPITPEQQPSRPNPPGDDHSANACPSSLNQQVKASSITNPVCRSTESGVEKEDASNEGEFSVDQQKEVSVANKADSAPKGQHVRRLSVQDRISLFENKQIETSGTGGKPVVAKSAELKRLPSDVQEKAVLRRWSGASDMSIDLGGDKKDIESPLCTPSYASASQTKSEDKKGLSFSDSTSSNKQDFKAVQGSVIDRESKLESLARSEKSGKAIYGDKQSTISSCKSTDASEGDQLISSTSTAESDVWKDQSSLSTHSKFSVNNLDQFRHLPGGDTKNFGLANEGKFKGFPGGNDATNKKQSKASRSKGDDIRSNTDLQHAGRVDFLNHKDDIENRGLFSSESRVRGSQRTAVDIEQSEASADRKKYFPSLEMGSRSGFLEDSISQNLYFERQVSDPEQFKRGYRDETDSAIGNSGTVLSSKYIEQASWVPDSFFMQPICLGKGPKQTKGNQDLNDELKVKANELERLFAEHKLRVPGDSISTRRNRSAVMPSESVATSSYLAPVINASPAQLPAKHSLDDPAGGFSYAVNFNSSTPLKLFENQNSGDASSNQISESSYADDSRGKQYETYMQKRNDKLRDDWSSRRTEKEAKLKSMQDSFERSASEMKAKCSGPTDRMDSVSTARRRAERLRSYNTRSNIGVEQKRLDFGQSDDDYLQNFQEHQNTSFNDDDLSRTTTNKKQFPNKSLSSTTPKTTVATVPKSAANKSANIGSGRRKFQSENPLAQSVPNFSEMRKENTKPSTAVTKINRPSRSYVRSKNTDDEVSALKEEKIHRLQSIRNSCTNPGDIREMFSAKPEGTDLVESKFEDEAEQSPYGRFKNIGAKPFLRKGNGKDFSIRAGVSKQKVSMEPETLKNEEDFAEEPAGNLKDAGDKELTNTVNEGHATLFYSEGRLSQEFEKWVSSDSENYNIVRPFSYVDPSTVAQLPDNVPDSPGESPVLWNSRSRHISSYTQEMSDIDVSVGSPVGSPVSWNSHSLSQIDNDAARMRKKWGAAQKPTLVTSSSNNQSRKDMTKGFKRLLKFGRKTRGTENLSDWISATTSEGDDDTEDARDPAHRLSEDLRKSRMGLPPDDSFNESDFYGEQVQSMQSSIPAPPQNFTLRDDHLSGSSSKAPRSFFSLSTFRTKGSDSKAR